MFRAFFLLSCLTIPAALSLTADTSVELISTAVLLPLDYHPLSDQPATRFITWTSDDLYNATSSIVMVFHDSLPMEYGQYWQSHAIYVEVGTVLDLVVTNGILRETLSTHVSGYPFREAPYQDGMYTHTHT